MGGISWISLNGSNRNGMALVIAEGRGPPGVVQSPRWRDRHQLTLFSRMVLKISILSSLLARCRLRWAKAGAAATMPPPTKLAVPSGSRAAAGTSDENGPHGGPRSSSGRPT
jgi:hypothetical protein